MTYFKPCIPAAALRHNLEPRDFQSIDPNRLLLSPCNPWQRLSAGQVLGFTLLEVLISIILISIIMGVLYGAYTSNLETVQVVRQTGQAGQTARIVLDLMTRDLESIFFREKIKRGDQEIKFGLIGEDKGLAGKPAARIDLTTTTHLTPKKESMRVDLCEVSYYLAETEGEEGLILWRRDSSVVDEKLDQGGETYELARNVNGLKITYQGQDGQETESWDTTADDKDKPTLPSLIRISLILKDPEGKEQVFMTCVHPQAAERMED